MSFFQRFKSILTGIVMLLFVALLWLLPKDAYYVAAGVLGLALLVYGFRLLWYYFTMARHMVGGKSILYQSVIVIDLGLFSSSLMSVSSAMVIFYLLAIYAFTGAIAILRAFEAKKFGGAWSHRLDWRGGCDRSGGARHHRQDRLFSRRLLHQPDLLRCCQDHFRFPANICGIHSIIKKLRLRNRSSAVVISIGISGR